MTEQLPVASQDAEKAGPPIRAVIDIGSNSIRLVAFRADRRTPMTLFNEKLMIGLGEGVGKTGRMEAARMTAGIEALRRFALLCRHMNTARVEAFATAAVRNAENGEAFCRRVRDICGIEITIIPGEEEGRYAALGVLAGIPAAEGVIGDLGGGSLELAHLKDGVPSQIVSLPIGALRLAEAREGGPRKMRKVITKALNSVEWIDSAAGLPFYMVGGSWRALAQLQMHLRNFPLPIAHQYRLSRDEIERLARSVPNLSDKRLSNIRTLSSQRVPHLPGAALLLRAVMRRLESSHAVVSAYGIREGVFFDGLPSDIAERDPLIYAARNEGRKLARFPHHAEALALWTKRIFADDSGEQKRLRRVACELVDVASSAHPDFRAERALEVGLRGNWVNIDHEGRAQLGAALFAQNGGPVTDPARTALAPLASFEKLDRATAWGLALRLGQRLSGGTLAALEQSRLDWDSDDLVLTLSKDYAALWSPAVEKRLSQLAMHLAADWRIEISE
ncbi:MAG: Ppx/GppA family phosphatase [Pacificimonas sp.]|nr:Ppx/GppA family phosphatase [Pacificimonas sp.]